MSNQENVTEDGDKLTHIKVSKAVRRDWGIVREAVPETVFEPYAADNRGKIRTNDTFMRWLLTTHPVASEILTRLRGMYSAGGN